VLKVLAVNNELQVSTKPLFSDLLSTNQAAKRIGCNPSRLRGYAVGGWIPGARQVGKHKRWLFDPVRLEKWWQNFNAPKPGEEN